MKVNAQEAWNIAIEQLELQLDRASFDTWLKDATLLKEERGIFYIGVRNNYARDMLQYRLHRDVRRVLSEVYGTEVELRFEVRKPSYLQQDPNEDMPLFKLLAERQAELGQQQSYQEPLHERVGRPERSAPPESELNPRFVFDRFVVNNSNRITYEAARAVSENPGRGYNPLLVYGGVGLGKTHLLHSIAQVCVAKGLQVIYVPSEAFTNDLVDAIRGKSTAMFRDRYRSADVLLVDDVQFISGKDSTQEEFFHTFNALYTFNKQIVLASDRHPRELKTLEDRLRSRFEGGLVTDVQPLEFESRVAILQMWAHERNVKLKTSVLEMIAGRAQSNVRELEGIFNQIVVQAQLSGGVTREGAEDTLDRFDRPRYHGGARVNVKRVIEVTASYFQLSPKDLTGKRRTGRVNQARQIAMYLTRELTEASLPQIGEAFGGRSHTTVLHGCNKISDELAYDRALGQQIEEVRNIVLGG